MRRFLAALALLLVTGGTCFSDCTSICFTAGKTVIFGNNLDWYSGSGMLVVNKRNVAKTGCWFSNKPSWTSKYGSITINQFGREFPSRGMNEAGLAVGEMTLSETRFPDPDRRPALSTLQWMQYQLDNFATVGEVIAGDAKVRIDSGEYHSHFLIADKTGACVSMEWLDGKPVFHTGDSLPVKVLTNDTYDNCITQFNADPSSEPPGYSSVARFLRAAAMIPRSDGHEDGSAVSYAFEILAGASPPNNQWNLVFDLTNRRFHVRTRDNRNIRYADFSSFDFSSLTPVKVFPLDNALSGDVSAAFVDYTYEVNRGSIDRIYTEVGWSVGNPSMATREKMARYPETTSAK